MNDEREEARRPVIHAFLRGMSPRQRELLASAARPFAAAPGELLTRAGEPAGAFFLVGSGHVTLSAGAVVVQTVGPGEVVGWSWLVPPFRWHFDARAVDTVAGAQLDAGWLRELCERDHAVGYAVLKRLAAVVAGRLVATRLQLLDVFR
jgi:CRP-like cAMP-binding protein